MIKPAAANSSSNPSANNLTPRPPQEPPAPAQTQRDPPKTLFEKLRRLIPTRNEARQHKALRWLGPLLEREWLWHLNRRTVASGAALGVFFGLIAPVGQIPLAAGGAVLLRANLPAAALGTLISNPLTIGPIYFLAYYIGAAILFALGLYQDLPGMTTTGPIETPTTPSGWLEYVANVGEPLILGLALLALGGALLAYASVRVIWRLNVMWQRRRRPQ